MKFSRKIGATFKERKQMVGHIFEGRAGEWHAFFFELREALELRDAHWVGGRHLHFVSHLWTRLSPQDVVAAVKEKGRLPREVHIRFTPQEYKTR